MVIPFHQRVLKGGYRMVRATHGVFRGSYYFEVEILPHSAPKSVASASADGENGSSSSETAHEVIPSPHIRIGWSTRQGELQAPVGFDQYSYGYRDSCGTFACSDCLPRYITFQQFCQIFSHIYTHKMTLYRLQVPQKSARRPLWGAVPAR